MTYAINFDFLFVTFRFAQFDNNLITPGKYRQRSYDNLKMGKCSSDVTHMMQMHSPSSLSKYRLSTNLSKINNEEHTDHRRHSCLVTATPSTKQSNRPIKRGTDRNVLSSSLVKLTPHVPTHYKVYGPQKKYKLKNAIDGHDFMYAYGPSGDRQNTQNNNRQEIDRWTAERLLLLRGDEIMAADSDTGNHFIDRNDVENRRIT